MTQEEYKKRLADLKNKFEADSQVLAKEFAFANNPYKIGDIVTDHYQTLRIERISFYRSLRSEPKCAYIGTLLKKDGTPKNGGEKGTVYQENIITANHE